LALHPSPLIVGDIKGKMVVVTTSTTALVPETDYLNPV
jgi:hypothetical protein